MSPHCGERVRRHRDGNLLTRYVRARLHRRIFFLLGGSIFLTGLIFVVTQWAFGGQTFRRQMAAAHVFVADLMGQVWDRPAERDALAQAIVTDLHFDVRLEDAAHAQIASFGATCDRPTLVVPVTRAGETVGYASICTDRARMWPSGAHFLPFGAAVVVLWAVSGRLARRLSRPYGELARVARDIGMGKLTSRYNLPAAEGGPSRGTGSRWAAYGEARLLSEAINDMASRIEKQMTDQRELLAAVSHEIRTPLSRIRLLVELCRGGSTPDGKHAVDGKTLDELDREVVEIDALVSELLASSRLDFAALSPHELDAADVAARALERLGESPGKLRVEDGKGRLSADATLLGRALANLIDNARSHGGGLDALVVRREGGRLVFEAVDRGPGLLPGEEARVFESFYQRQGDEPREKGALGLGLTLVKRIAEAHGGRAFARNREGGGACVGLELPALPAA